MFLYFLLIITIISIIINTFFVFGLLSFLLLFLEDLKKHEHFFEKIQLACTSQCKNDINTINDIFHFPKENILMSKNMSIVGSTNENNIKSIEDIRNKMHIEALNFIHKQKTFIIFFDKLNFSGKMYFIKARRNIIWNNPFFKDEDNIHQKVLEENEDENNNSNIDEEEDNNIDFLEERKNIIPIENFLKLFDFYKGREFSCIIPYGTIIKFIPTQRESVNSSPLILREGNHKNVYYYRSTLKRFEIKNIIEK